VHQQAANSLCFVQAKNNTLIIAQLMRRIQFENKFSSCDTHKAFAVVFKLVLNQTARWNTAKKVKEAPYNKD
jgi:hypothetical protein